MQMSDHFTYKKLLIYSIPSIVMLIITSVYVIVDGFFISNFIGVQEFASVNFIFPILMILGTIGYVFGIGGSALIGKKIGEEESEKANEIFTLLIFTSIIIGIIVTVVGFIILKPATIALGAKGELLDNGLKYGYFNLIGIIGYILQIEFQCLFPTAGKPKLGLYISIAIGICNIVLDAIFIIFFKWGLPGAAIATSISQFVGGIIPLIYFNRPNNSLLRFTKLRFDGSALIQSCFNGASELLNNISASIVGMLYNVQLLKYAGENGVASYGIMMYLNFIFTSIFIGYLVGSSPIISYNFGAENKRELKSLCRKSIVIIMVFSFLMFIFSKMFTRQVSNLFIRDNALLLEMTINGFSIFSYSFLFVGFAIFGSSFFTALNDGLVSVIIAGSRSLIFQVGFVLILPLILGLNGIWISVVLAEFMAVCVSVIFIILKRKKYGY